MCRGPVKKQWAKPFHVTRDGCTCDPARCTSVALQAAGGICRSSALVSEGIRLWQYQSSAAIDDMLRRNAGTCYLSSAWRAPCMHPNDCYSTLNRSRSHLAVRGRRKGMHTEASTSDKCCKQPPNLPTRRHYNKRRKNTPSRRRKDWSYSTFPACRRYCMVALGEKGGREGPAYWRIAEVSVGTGCVKVNPCAALWVLAVSSCAVEFSL